MQKVAAQKCCQELADCFKMPRPHFPDFTSVLHIAKSQPMQWCLIQNITLSQMSSLLCEKYHNFCSVNMFEGSINSTNLGLLFKIPAVPGRQSSGYWAEFNQHHLQTYRCCTYNVLCFRYFTASLSKSTKIKRLLGRI